MMSYFVGKYVECLRLKGPQVLIRQQPRTIGLVASSFSIEWGISGTASADNIALNKHLETPDKTIG